MYKVKGSKFDSTVTCIFWVSLGIDGGRIYLDMSFIGLEFILLFKLFFSTFSLSLHVFLSVTVSLASG